MAIPTADSIKVSEYLEKLKKGSKIHIATLAKELGVAWHVIWHQLKNFKGKFEVLEGKNPWFDPKTRLPYTKDGIRFEPKLFQYSKNNTIQNKRLWQSQTTGEWKVLTQKGTRPNEVRTIHPFKSKEGALKFFEDYKIKTSGEMGKIRRYLDAEIAKSGGKKLSFASAKDLKTKANSTIGSSDLTAILKESKYVNQVKKFPLRETYIKPFTEAQKKSLVGAFSGDVKKWDFKNYKYGFDKTKNPKLYQRMELHLRGEPWRFGFNFKAPGGWMIQQMDRAGTRYKNPQYESILNKAGKVIGIKDNGVAYYANRALAPSNASKLISSHPNFEQVQKLVDIAAKARTPLISQTDKASKALVELFPKGFDASRLSLTNLLSYVYKDKGLEAARNAIQLHHIEPMKSLGAAVDPKNIMLLRRDLNVLANTVDQQIRKGDVSRVPELKKAGVKIKVGDVAYGGGTQDPTKILRQETEALREPLSKYKPKDWAKLQTWLIDSFKKGSVKEQRLTAAALNCPFTKAEGGRIGYALGSATINCVNTKLTNEPVQSSMKLRVAEGVGKIKPAAINFLKLLGRGGLKAAPYAALAAAGAAIEPLVKFFRNDDPTTYLTDESQMKGMLLATIEGETPKVDEELLNWQYPGMAASAAAAIPGSSAMMKARKAKGFGTPRAALGPVGKFLAGTFSPLGVAATLPISVAAQRKGGTEWGDIATDPLNWMAPAFASTGARMATRGMAPTGILAKALRMGMSPRTLSLVSRRFGMPGLAISAGMWGYDKWKNRSINDED